MNEEDRGPWYLLTGLVVGLVLGLLYSWWFRPVIYTNTTPASLQPAYKDRYRALVAAAYLADGDIVRAKARLSLLKDDDMYQRVAEQAQRTLAEGQSIREARALGLLAVAVGQIPPTQAGSTGAQDLPSQLSTPSVTPSLTPDLTFTALAATLSSTETVTVPLETPTAAVTPTNTVSFVEAVTETSAASIALETSLPASPTFNPEPLPTRTATPTPAAAFSLKSRDLLCDKPGAVPLLQVEAQDASGKPVPGVLVIVEWQGGSDRFYTGLKPELGAGYADFNMDPGVLYTLRLGEGGQPVSDLQASGCNGSTGAGNWGAWKLVFVQQ